MHVFEEERINDRRRENADSTVLGLVREHEQKKFEGSNFRISMPPTFPKTQPGQQDKKPPIFHANHRILELLSKKVTRLTKSTSIHPTVPSFDTPTGGREYHTNDDQTGNYPMQQCFQAQFLIFQENDPTIRLKKKKTFSSKHGNRLTVWQPFETWWGNEQRVIHTRHNHGQEPHL